MPIYIIFKHIRTNPTVTPGVGGLVRPLRHSHHGHPRLRASSVEFQPQWVTKHPTAGCASTANCGHHATTTPPASSLKNSCRESLSPCAISAVCSAERHAKLPKETYTTDAAGLPSSHRRQAASALSRSIPCRPSPSGTVGPTVRAFMWSFNPSTTLRHQKRFFTRSVV
ncbi:unnamed protein product [Spirodela intermedia]|uniref:Uncharacterized protein n=1 Tax=Spirodela intermedia TaxID=51605 RepID=A0A7I8IP97_SPIIN|nr:unnamed protein product [Spirodela intermedia]CAA6658961.1 unnamed protein product [Spirodela intermedia]